MEQQAIPAGSHDHSSAATLDAAHYAPFVTTANDGTHSLSLAVAGVHCPACIQKIESALQNAPNVTHARLNYSTKRLALSWKGAAQDADALVKRVTDLGYRAAPYDPGTAERSDDEQAQFLRLCLGISGFATGNIMLLSFGLWITDAQIMGMATREFLHLISAVIAVPAVAFAGRPFFRSAASVLAKGKTNMDVPISLAIILATVMSLSELYRGGEHVYFDSAVMLMFFLLIGRYLDFLALSSARRAASGLLSMMAGSATVIDDDGRARSVLIRDLREGMVVQIASGERIPADGHVISGTSDIDASLVTGESRPVPIKTGDEALSGTMNIGAPLRLRIARAAEDSMLANIVRLMEKAEQGSALYTRLADRAARLYTPVVHVLAASAFLGWLLLGGIAWQEALMVAVTVLIITCPCALGLAVPVTQLLSVGKLMRAGVMVKSGDALERLAVADTVMLDKTGTLTRGAPTLVDAGGGNMQLASSIASHSRHPLSRALVNAYDGPLLDLTVTEHPGKGLETTWQGKTIRLGSRAWCGDDATAQQSDTWQEIWLHVPGETPARFTFSDVARDDARETIDRLRALGLRPVLASGDREEAVRELAVQMDIDDWRARMTPDQKYAWLEDLRGSGAKVLMIGDGLNDAPVLAGADVSASPASGLDIARNAADIVFTGDRLAPVPDTITLARFTQKLVRQNFALAIIYNVFAVPLAFAGLVTPMVAAIAMSSSSLIVIANAFRIRLVRS